MLFSRNNFLAVFSVVCILAELYWAFDEHDDSFTETTDTEDRHEHQPKDKILLKNVKSLTFHRHKKTTARRTTSLNQLSCVGGTAGCKLFTPNVSIAMKRERERVRELDSPIPILILFTLIY